MGLAFEFWDGSRYRSYGTAEQALLLEAFHKEPCPAVVELPGGRHSVHNVARIANGDAVQVNASTQTERHVRVRPPYRLSGATPPRLPAASVEFQFQVKGWETYGADLQRDFLLAASSSPPPSQLRFIADGRPYRLLGLDTLAADGEPNIRQENVVTGFMRKVRVVPSTRSDDMPVRRPSGLGPTLLRSLSSLSSLSRCETPVTEPVPQSAPLLQRASFWLDLRPRLAAGCLPVGYRDATRSQQSLDSKDKDVLFAALKSSPRPETVSLPSGWTVGNLCDFETGGAGAVYQSPFALHSKQKAMWSPLQMSLPRAISGKVHLPEDLDVDDDAGAFDIAAYGRPLSQAEAKELFSSGGAVGSGHTPNTCSICLSEVVGEGSGSAFELPCKHVYHQECISHWFGNRKRCPQCQHDFGKVTGNQPRIGMMQWQVEQYSLPGHTDARETIVLHFAFPPGVDDDGREFQGRTSKGYLPGNREGIILLELFKVAFRRRVMYGLGQSMTREVYRPTFNIHIKTSRQKGAEGHGYPDPSYFGRALEELRTNGVTISDLI